MEDWNPIKTETKVTVEDLQTLCERVSEARQVLDKAAEEKKSADNLVDSLERELIEMLSTLNLKSFKTKDYNYIRTVRSMFRVPRGEDRTVFFDYLKDKGLFDEMITVNSQTLNSYAKSVLDAAEREGRLSEVQIPGLGQPELTETIQVRKNSK